MGETTTAREMDAVVLAGGDASRMAGRDKLVLDVGGIPLLLRTFGALADAERVIVVGPARPGLTDRPRVHLTREEPPGGGPVAAIAAGLRLVSAPWVAVLAGDHPFVTAELVRSLVAAARGHDGAVLLDDTGRRQHLVGVWSTVALRGALAVLGDPRGAPAGRLLAGLDAAEVQAWPDDAPPWLDCDTDDDLTNARRLA